MNLDTDAIEAFLAVVETGSFARAAERLNKAQSAVSYQVSKLEKALRIALFDRGGYRAALTEQGKIIAQECGRLMEQAEQVQRLAARYKEGWEPALELVIDGALPMDPVMQALKGLTAHDIPTRIQVRVEFLGGVQSRFEKHQADLMLVKDLTPKPGLVATPLPVIHNLLVVSSNHPLARMRGITRDALIRFVELTVNDATDTQSMAADAHQFGGEKVFYLSGFIYKKRALEMGLGFGWMPEFLIRDELQQGSLVVVDYIGGCEYSFTPHLVWSDARPLGRAGRQLKAAIEAAFN